MRALGTQAPNFALPDTTGALVSLSDYSDRPGLLVAFICNHCPFVIHLREVLAAVTRSYMEQGLGVVAVSSNDVDRYPQDGPAEMAVERRAAGYAFPYLFDESQEVAKAYGAACTPDFFLYDGNGQLCYRGQFDASRPGNDVDVTGADLTAAVSALLSDSPVNSEQVPSIGCNIKWKPGNAPPYFG